MITEPDSSALPDVASDLSSRMQVVRSGRP
jgi:hypothetical protein